MTDEEGRKIIIDEDWKSQVQREKEQAAEQEPDGDAEQGEIGGEKEAEGTPLTDLVSFVSMQAAAAMGMFAPRDAETVQVNLDMAKLLIDGLTALREKTADTLTPVEKGLLNRSLAELQQMYVMCSEAVQQQALGIDPNALRTP